MRGLKPKLWSEERTTAWISFAGRLQTESHGPWEANRDTIALTAVGVLTEKLHAKPWNGTESFYGCYSKCTKSHSHFFWNEFQVVVMSLYVGVWHLKISRCSISLSFPWSEINAQQFLYCTSEGKKKKKHKKLKISCRQPLYSILLFLAPSSPSPLYFAWFCSGESQAQLSKHWVLTVHEVDC